MVDGEPRRVVVTGVGMITSVGLEREAAIRGLVDGRSGLSYLSFEHPDVRIGGEIKDFDPAVDLKEIADRRTLKKSPIAGMYSLGAAFQALSQAELLDSNGHIIPIIDREHVSVVIGTSLGGAHDQDVDNPKRSLVDKLDPSNVYPILRILPERVATVVEIRYGTKGSTYTPVAACNSGVEAIGQGYNLIANQDPKKRIDIAIVGGTDATVTPLITSSFNTIGALSKAKNLDQVSLPFDAKRSGFHHAEGAGVLILEEYQHALGRGVTPLAELIGFGSASDGDHETNTKGEGLQRAMQQAFSTASEFPKAGDVIVAHVHATATPEGDGPEKKVLDAVLPIKKDVFIYAPKGALGHTQGASGAIASAIAVLGLNRGFIPPNHYNVPMDGMEDYNFSKEAVQVYAAYALVNSGGFGGLNGSLVFAAMRD